MKYWVLIFAVAGMSFGIAAQVRQNNPPPPMASNHGNGNGRGPCGQLPENANGGGPRIPPPVGLCLPINDYLLPFLLVGIAFGGYKIWKLEKFSEAKKGI
ncbi:hypothetical protein [Salinimicrobium sp. HB62]|uniref:hypothetical protein n=1 Tax=Salinimicrobium sp. HB62 TaxID=3077781 RepID=UPI002D769018|nr:hypothetical protein [Salinimicrobium sp. HB62]